MRHQDLTINHRLESWVYANDAARTGATGFVTGDVGRIAFQTDSGDYWRLISTTPTWQKVAAPLPPGGTTGQPLIKNSVTNYDASWKSPGATVASWAPGTFTGATAVMSGSGARFIPLTTGKLFILFVGLTSNNTAATNMQCQLRWGTGGSPTKGVGAIGNVVGAAPAVSCTTIGAASMIVTTGTVSGFTLGTDYWFDVTVAVNGGGTGTLSGPTISINEI